MRSINREYLGSVDQIRAYAVVLVVFYHSIPQFSGYISHGSYDIVRDWHYSRDPLATLVYEGHSSVALFMVLSGFIFTVGTLARRVSFTRFMTNRFLRIYPLFLVLLFMGIAARQGNFTFLGFLQAIIGLTNIPGSVDLGPIGHMFWAIGVEVQFYLIFPALNAVLRRFGMGTFLRMFLAVFLIRGLAWLVSRPVDPNTIFYSTIAGRIDQFLFGMIAAYVYLRHRDKFRGWWKLLIAIAVPLAVLWEYNQLHGAFSMAWYRAIWGDVEGLMWALFIVVYVATVRGNNVALRGIAKIGELSYSIYLLHFMILTEILNRHVWLRIPGLNANADAFLSILLIVMPITLAVSWVTYSGIEQPFLRFRVKYLIPDPDTAPVAAVGGSAVGGKVAGGTAVEQPAAAPPPSPVPA